MFGCVRLCVMSAVTGWPCPCCLARVFVCLCVCVLGQQRTLAGFVLPVCVCVSAVTAGTVLAPSYP